jgi:hypothetical protein
MAYNKGPTNNTLPSRCHHAAYPFCPMQVRRVVDSIRLETVDARAMGQSMLDIAAHVLVNSVERAAATGGAGSAARALAVSNTSR